MKAILAAGAIVMGACAPAMAGPYVETEARTGYSGGAYKGGVVHLHGGYSRQLNDRVSVYAQGGPALRLREGSKARTEVSGKAGVKVALADKLQGYGEVSGITVGGADFGRSPDMGLKAGVRYSF
jgi:hypothetical protein